MRVGLPTPGAIHRKQVKGTDEKEIIIVLFKQKSRPLSGGNDGRVYPVDTGISPVRGLYCRKGPVRTGNNDEQSGL
jgi:hypothetical protein